MGFDKNYPKRDDVDRLEQSSLERCKFMTPANSYGMVSEVTARRRSCFLRRRLSVQRHRRSSYLFRRELGESGVDANFPHFDSEAMHSSKLLYFVDVVVIEVLHRFCEMTKIAVVHDAIATQFDAFVDPAGKPLFEIVHAPMLTEPSE